MNRVFVVCRVALVVAAIVAPAGAWAQQAVNPMHPTFVPLDEHSQPTRSATAVSDERTCSGCHDVNYITAHSGHTDAGVKVGCVQCHVDGGQLDVRPEFLDEKGQLRREALRIGSPTSQNCASCHGLIFGARDTVILPDDFDAARDDSGRTYSLTTGEGAIISPQSMNDSFLNLEGKDRLAAPWDVHAAKLVECSSCHFASNNPVHADDKQARLKYLTDDPRRTSTGEYLARPDHRLAMKNCRNCHDPLEAHQFLPYRQRHMEMLACQTCHTSSPRGPALEMVDATVARLDGKPSMIFRNLARRPGEPLSVATLSPFQPLLVDRVDSDGAHRLAPVNPVGRWRWVAGAKQDPVPFAKVVEAFVKDGRYIPEVLTALDTNRDGVLGDDELRLDTQAKTDLIASHLRDVGVVEPSIEGTLLAYPIAHGVSTREQALRDCNVCHANDSRLSDSYPIAAYLPGGVPPRPPDGPRVDLAHRARHIHDDITPPRSPNNDLAGLITPSGEGGLVLRGAAAGESGTLHVLGYSRHSLTNTLGLLFFAAVFLGASAHGLTRFVMSRGRAAQPHVSHEKTYAFGLYERIWHWTMALSGIVLIITGMQIHMAGEGGWLPLPTAVALHNAFAIILLVNAFLALFYNLTTAAIRNFIPSRAGLIGRMLEHMKYYSRGIFYPGGKHPSNEPGQKLNPMQQLTYLALLNVLFPFQIITGLLIWAVGHWPSLGAAMGGLRVLAPAHNLGSWLFLSFIVLHVYLVTTGRTVGEHLKSMITGYQATEPKS